MKKALRTRIFGTRLGVIATSSVVVLVLTAVAAIAAGRIPGADGVIHGCYSTTKGSLRVIDPTVESCTDRESAITWNQAGPAGAAGADGIPGAPGLVWRGAWDESARYEAGDAVTVKNNAWIAIERNENTPPEFGSDVWDLLAPSGRQGPSGLPGARGEQGPPGTDGEGVSSIDDLSGKTCNVGTPEQGTVVVSYGNAGAISMRCVPSTLHALTIVAEGSGGTISSDPAGIDCGADCSQSYPHGTQVTLTANYPAHRAIFEGWSGACSGTANTCTVTMDAAKSVLATFSPGYELVIFVDSLHNPYYSWPADWGTGNVATATPRGEFSCGVTGGEGATCRTVIHAGTQLTLTATPHPNDRFAGWGYSCAGTEPTCTITMNRSHWIRAQFEG